mmetsp:Transcript_8200/g.22258  ORF Transcript_8200/g.22258 Transcript_8200/m.22258 type:complete len:137 (-) Transcript_8200:636-1046(-)
METPRDAASIRANLDDEDIVKLLEDQYRYVERYCNAQTALWNQCTSSNPTSHCVTSLARCLDAVRANFRALRQLDARALQRHVEISRRVLQTIGNNPGWTAEGLPSSSNVSSVAANTVALATLKASMEAVLDALVL